jgi:hypothetical protein
VSGNYGNSLTAGVDGGGLFNEGTLTLRHCTVSGNTAGRSGGGLANEGRLTLSRSTLSGNTATYGGGLANGGTQRLARSIVSGSSVSGNTASRFGGGLYNRGTLTLARSTVSGNTTPRSVFLLDGGGGLYNTGWLKLVYSTVSDNTAGTFGGGLWQARRGRLRFRNSLIAGNAIGAGGSGPDCAGDDLWLHSRGHNLVGAGTGCPSDPSVGDLTVDPATVFTQVLGPLQDNGGPTWTHALLPGSPAIDMGDPDKCPPKDQRGVPRPQGAGCDIGAFELEQP